VRVRRHACTNGGTDWRTEQHAECGAVVGADECSDGRAEQHAERGAVVGADECSDWFTN